MGVLGFPADLRRAWPASSRPDGIDGISVVPTLLGHGEQKTHDYLYWEFHEGGSKQAVRFGDWKAVRLKPDGPIELYDLRADVGEQQNVAGRTPDLVAKADRNHGNRPHRIADVAVRNAPSARSRTRNPDGTEMRPGIRDCADCRRFSRVRHG